MGRSARQLKGSVAGGSPAVLSDFVTLVSLRFRRVASPEQIKRAAALTTRPFSYGLCLLKSGIAFHAIAAELQALEPLLNLD